MAVDRFMRVSLAGTKLVIIESLRSNQNLRFQMGSNSNGISVAPAVHEFFVSHAPHDRAVGIACSYGIDEYIPVANILQCLVRNCRRYSASGDRLQYLFFHD